MRISLVVGLMVLVISASAQTSYDFPKIFSDPLTINWQQFDEPTMEYIKRNNIRYVIRQNSNSNYQESSFKIAYYFDSIGRIDSVKHYTNSGSKENQFRLAYFYTYNLSGKMSSRMSKLNLGNNPILFKEELTYDKQGRVSEMISSGGVLVDNHLLLKPNYTIAYDTTIRSMVRYKVQYPEKLVAAKNKGSVSNSAKKQPYYYWYENNELVLKGTDSSSSYVDVKTSNMGYEVSCFRMEGTNIQLLAKNEYDVNWHVRTKTLVTIDSGNTVNKLIEENRYDNQNRIVLKIAYPLFGDATPASTTYFRNKGTGHLIKESVYKKGFVTKGAIQNMPLPPKEYTYTYFKVIPK